MSRPEFEIGTEPSRSCPLCGMLGLAWYEELQDFVFGAPGEWSMRCCSNLNHRIVFLDPRPRADDIKRAYESYYTHTESRRPEADFLARKILRGIYNRIRSGYFQVRFGYRHGVGPKWWRVFAPLAFLHPAGTDAFAVDAMFLPARTDDGKLLEIGCGDGLMLERMRERGWTVEGVESDPECIRRTKARGLKCHLGDLRQLALPDNAFDAIYMGNVIEHIYEPKNFLLECLRVLKPKGNPIIVTPNSRSFGHWYFRQDWRGLEPPRHLQIFDTEGLRQLCEATGFEQCRARTTNRGAWYIIGMSTAIRTARRKHCSRCEAAASLFSWSGLIYETLGRLFRLVAPGIGEEIILLGCKP
jgi:2-polyprenyl-3-methyl-5-hydroxy-6-metoxy-1,4-benzoquinol methylase